MARKEKYIHVRITPELHDKFSQSVIQNDQEDMSTVIRDLIKRYIKETASPEQIRFGGKITT